MDLPVWFEPQRISFNYTQMRYFLLPNLCDLRNGDYPPEPDEYKTWDKFWMNKKKSTYTGGNSNRFSTVGRFVRAVELAAEIDYRIEQIKTYHIEFDGIAVPVNGILVYDAFVNEIVLNTDLLHEAHLMLEYVSGWDRRKDFKKWKERTE